MKNSKKSVFWILSGLLLISLAINIRLVVANRSSAAGQYLLASLPDAGNTDGNVSIQLKTNQTVVYQLSAAEVRNVEPVAATKAVSLPEKIIIHPGIYTFRGKSYSLTHEGLYRFIVPGTINSQRIVYKDDSDALFSAISWIVTHGNADDKKSLSMLSEKALHAKLFLTCGPVSHWAQSLLYSVGIDSRIVGGITVDEWNDYDNGHILLEVWRQEWNKWVVYDFDNNRFFLPVESEIPLSLVEWSRSVREAKYRTQQLADDTRLDVSDFIAADGYDYGFYMEAINADSSTWYRRVMQVPLIYDDKERLFRFMDAGQKARVEAYSADYKYMDRDSFMEKYYNVEH